MKKSYNILLVVLIVAVAGWFASKQINTIPAPVSDGLLQYSSAEYSISFSYPDTYVLNELDAPGSELRKHHVITLMRRDELPAVEGGEGPTYIALEMYQNNLDNQTAEGWIKNTSESNYKLGDGTLTSITLANGLPATSYRWSGLYEGTTIVTAQPKWVYALTVTYMEMGAPIIQDFVAIRDSIKITQ